MNAYYQQLDKKVDQDGTVTTTYQPLIHAQGAWNEHEQHMAPATGIICAELEQFSPRVDMRIARISLDIFGLIPLEQFSISTQIIRPGKTIELIESTMSAKGRICIVARAWRMLIQDTRNVAEIEDKSILQPEQFEPWLGMQTWPGGFIQSIETRNQPDQHRHGKGTVWATTTKDMIEGKETSDFVRLMGIADIANGIAPRQELPFSWGFPNLDLQLHMYRLPQGKWLGIEGVQQYGIDGVGLSSAVLHDIYGPFGRSEQIITLRKI